MAEAFFRRRRTVTFNDPLAGVTVFDTGSKQMGRAISAAAAAIGPIGRVVLGNAPGNLRSHWMQGLIPLDVPIGFFAVPGRPSAW